MASGLVVLPIDAQVFGFLAADQFQAGEDMQQAVGIDHGFKLLCGVMRWTSVRETRVVEVDDLVNYPLGCGSSA
jgi:hypothetical protein